MKFAVLCAFVFGTITVAGTAAPFDRHVFNLKRDYVSSSNGLDLRKRQGGIAEAFGHAFTGAAPEAENVAHAAGGATRGSTSYIFNEASHTPQGAPATAADNAMMAKILKNQKKLKNMYEQDREAVQLQQIQAQRAAEETALSKQAVVSPVAKAGGSWTKTKMVGGLAVGGIGGYALTKMLTTKPADTATQYNPTDTAALTAAGGSGVPGAANAPAAGAGGSFGPGTYTDPKTGIQYSVDAAGNVSLVPASGSAGAGAVPAQGANMSAAPSGSGAITGTADPATAGAVGNIPATANAPGLYVDRTTGLQYYVDANGKATPAGAAAGTGAPQTNAASTSATTGSGANPFAPGTATGGSTGAAIPASGSANPATAAVPASANVAATDASGAQNANTVSTGTAAANQPQWDSSVNMYYVVSQDGTPYYIEPTSHMLINGKTGQIVDPQTGQVVDPNTLTGSSGSASPVTGSSGSSTASPATGLGGASGSPATDTPSPDPTAPQHPTGDKAKGRNGGDGTVASKTDASDSSADKTATGNSGSSSALQKRFVRKRQVNKAPNPNAARAGLSSNGVLRSARSDVVRSLVPRQVAAPAGMSKTKLGLMIGGGLAAVFGTVLLLDNIAHPKLSNTSPANPYGLHQTQYCNVYGVPFVQDHWGTVWDKSTYTKVDPNNPPIMSPCSTPNAGGEAVAGFGTVTSNLTPAAAVANAPQKRSLAESSDTALTGVSLQKRRPLGWTAAGLTVASGSILYITYLEKLHKAKEQAELNAYNSEYHTAGDAASSQGNSITTGAAGQLFNPMSGNLVLVDQNSGQTYDSGTGEAVSSQTGLPLAYSGTTLSPPTDTTASSGVRRPATDSQSSASTTQDPSIDQAMAEWNAKTPQEQQQLLAQYGQAATTIASSPDPTASLQQYKNQLLSSPQISNTQIPTGYSTEGIATGQQPGYTVGGTTSNYNSYTGATPGSTALSANRGF